MGPVEVNIHHPKKLDDLHGTNQVRVARLSCLSAIRRRFDPLRGGHVAGCLKMKVGLPLSFPWSASFGFRIPMRVYPAAWHRAIVARVAQEAPAV